MKLAYLVFYDGTRFRGFVGSVNSVEHYLRKAFATLCYLDIDEIKIKCASRTDPGVSAIKNVIALDVPRFVRPEEVNSKLPEGIRVWGVAKVPDSFNPRSAYLRRYIYVKPYEGEDLNLVREASRMFIGKHDFSNFQIVDEELSPETEVYNIDVRIESGLVVYTFEGSGFRNKMIRKIVWALTQVGRGQLSIDTLRKLLNVEIRRTVPSAPAEGLILVDVRYKIDPEFTLSYRALNEIIHYMISRAKTFLALFSALNYGINILTEYLVKYIMKK